MDEHRTILLDSLGEIFVDHGRVEGHNPSASDSFSIFILYEAKVFGLIVPVNIFYRSYEKLLEVSHDRRITFQGKPLTDLELMIFQTAFDESLRLIRIDKAQMRHFEWLTRTGKLSNDPFQLSLGLPAKNIGYKLPDLSFLRSGSPTDIVKILCWEHPRAVALVLSHLDNRVAVNVLEGLPVELRAELPFDLLDLRNGRIQKLLKQINFTEFLAS